jgi:5-methylcytosine-specific restriction endonuclease McrA
VPYNGPVVTREQANAQRLTRFFTGKPCKHGHLSERTTCNGGCIQCNAESISSLYYAETPEQRKARQAKNKLWKDGNREQVREAGRAYSKSHREQNRAWKAVNHEKVLAGSRDYYQRNRESIRAKVAAAYDPERAAAYYLANADAIKARANVRHLTKPDDVRASKKAWYAANKDVVKFRVREWNAANPEATRSRGRNYRARLNGADGSHTAGDILALYVKQEGLCVYCQTPLGKQYDVDHIQPLFRGGSNGPENLQLLCAPCNNKKRATDPDEYVRRLRSRKET